MVKQFLSVNSTNKQLNMNCVLQTSAIFLLLSINMIPFTNSFSGLSAVVLLLTTVSPLSAWPQEKQFNMRTTTEVYSLKPWKHLPMLETNQGYWLVHYDSLSSFLNKGQCHEQTDINKFISCHLRLQRITLKCLKGPKDDTSTEKSSEFTTFVAQYWLLL